MKLLPILWDHEPTADDWAALSAAKRAIGYSDPIKPCRAVYRSPGRVLAVGIRPPWLASHYSIDSVQAPELKDALAWCLGEQDVFAATEPVDQLSMWFDGVVTFVGEESYDGE
jgi:hypothetical protein